MKARKPGPKVPAVPTHHVTSIRILREVLTTRHSKESLREALKKVSEEYPGIHKRDALLEAAKLLGEIREEPPHKPKRRPTDSQ